MKFINKSNYFIKYIGVISLIGAFCLASIGNNASYSFNKSLQFSPADSTKKDSLSPSQKKIAERKKKSQAAFERSTPKYNLKDRQGDPYNNKQSKSPLYLKEPSNVERKVTLGDSGKTVYVTEKVGKNDYRPPTRMTFDEYSRIKNKKNRQEYWKKASVDTSMKSNDPNAATRLIPKLNLPGNFDRIFGSNVVDIKPNGNVVMDFGGRWQFVDNPNIPVRQRRSGGFNFDQNIALNVQGKIGERLKVSINWDTKATFDFDNNMKLSFSGMDHDIIKSIEAGNVSFPLPTTLISGSQNLFGIKTHLQFGRLKVLTINSRQRSKVEDNCFTLGNGTGPGRPVEVRCDNYENDRHFFLSQYFRNQFEKTADNPTSVMSPFLVSNVDVYITNRSNIQDKTKGFVAFADLGESKPKLEQLSVARTEEIADMSSNRLLEDVGSLEVIKNPDMAETALTARGYIKGEDYEIVQTSRKLEIKKDFTLNDKLGYISLVSPLKNDEVLAVAFSYKLLNADSVKIVGETVGRVSSDQTKLVLLKLIRPSNVRVDLPMWNLQMKNIYNLGVSNITKRNFRMQIIYKDDNTGLDQPRLQEGEPSTSSLVDLLGVDKINSSNDAYKDGNWDFTGLTIDSLNGRLIFPVLEPFGKTLQGKFGVNEQSIASRYIFPEIYRKTKSDLQNYASKAKFFIKGTVSSGIGTEIPLNGLNITPESVKVFAGARQLSETDYQVIGNKIRLSDAIAGSGQQICVRYERADLFNFRQKSLTGARLEYAVNKDVNIGTTIMHLNERPLITRVNSGDEPVKNTMLGFDVAYKSESRLLTRMIDRLPLLSTKEPSSLQFSAEYARLMPGHSKVIGEKGNAFIDDFEAARNPFDLTRFNQGVWKLASTPASLIRADTNLSYAYRRAKLAWYNIDLSFYPGPTSGRVKPGNISTQDLKNHYVRPIAPNEIYPSRSVLPGQLNETTLDLAYFPSERGTYNYNPDLTTDGLLKDPRRNFAGITRALVNMDTDFDNANVQYVEFWLMDPFINTPNGGVVTDGKKIVNTSGGKLFLNLGNVSEDVLSDGKQSFESGLPENYTDESTQIKKSPWGHTPNKPFLTNAFSNNGGARPSQDVGLDGLSDGQEQNYFKSAYLDKLPNLSPDAKAKIEQDPSNDNFKFFLGSDLDAKDAKIIDRYKNWNGIDNNTPISAGTLTGNQSNYSVADNEDLNNNNIVDNLEGYYEYGIDLNPGQITVGKNYCVGVSPVKVDGEEINWYQFRVPIRDPGRKKVGSIDGFKTIRFMRMYLTEFEQPVVLRFAQFQLAGSQWRTLDSLYEESTARRIPEPREFGFNVSTVSVEENATGSGESSPYVIPPGFIRDQNNTTYTNIQLNEQSLRVCMDNLPDRTGKGVFKDLSFNFINYEKLKLFIHAEGAQLKDKDLEAYIRIGTDMEDNYYEIRVPLRNSNVRSSDENEVWPIENQLDVSLATLSRMKLERSNDPTRSLNAPFNAGVINEVNGYKQYVIVKGNPDLTAVMRIMLGVINPRTPNDDGAAKSACIWFNELRVSGFNEKAGWAALGKVNMKLADFATVSLAGNYSGVGFGQIEQKIATRSQEKSTSWDVGANMAMHKFIPGNLGIKVPLYIGYGEKIRSPKNDPANPDVPLEASAASQPNPKEYKRIMQDRTYLRSINLTNLQKVKTKPNAKSRVYDVENLSLSLFYNDMNRSSFMIYKQSTIQWRSILTYTYSPNSKPFEPFKKANMGKGSMFKPIKDINFSYLPSGVSVSGELSRSFTRTSLRNKELTEDTNRLAKQFEKQYTFTRRYNVRWSFTKSFSMDYNASAYAVVDEDLDNTLWQRRKGEQPVKSNLEKGGRLRSFDQSFNFTYKLPLNKFTLTEWIGTDVNYNAKYLWTVPGSVGAADTLGNTVQNGRDITFSSNFDLLKLYNKSKFLKSINNPTPNPVPRTKTIIKDLPNGKKDTIIKKLPEFRLAKRILRFAMSLRNVTSRYTINEGIMMPGYMRKSSYMGLDNKMAPGIPFILGSQNTSPFLSSNDSLITTFSRFSEPMRQMYNTKFSGTANLEPFKDLKIGLTFTKNKEASYQQTIKWKNDHYAETNPTRSGNYEVSIITFKTAFVKDKSDNSSANFIQYVNNKSIIQRRLNDKNTTNGSFATNSQDVLVPAFLAAYSKTDANKIALSPFPKLPLPNWNMDYAGLVNIPAIKRKFSSFSLKHTYTSLYKTGPFQASAVYNTPQYLSLHSNEQDNTMPTIYDPVAKDFVPIYQLQNVTINENMVFGINSRTKNNWTIRVDYKRGRNLSLILVNAQVAEQITKGGGLTLGYSKSGITLPFIKNKGTAIILKNETQFNCTVNVNDTKNIQRNFLNEVYINTVNSGNVQIQIRPNITYVVSQRLNVQLYYTREVNRPKVSNQFKRITTTFGIQVRFTLS